MSTARFAACGLRDRASATSLSGSTRGFRAFRDDLGATSFGRNGVEILFLRVRVLMS